MLNDVTGKLIRSWDSRGHQFRTKYDALRRPLYHYVQGTIASVSDPRTIGHEVLFEKTVYGEDQPDDIALKLNLRTRVFQQYDGAGVVTNMDRDPETSEDEAYDFKGNLLRSTRQLAQDYKAVPNWSNHVDLDREIFRSSTTYDALNRPVTLATPDLSITRHSFNEANLLNAIDVNLRGEQQAGQPAWTSFVTNIDYNAKGQRTRIDYGNGATTTYEYDPNTFRLIHLKTTRPPAQNDLASQLFKSPGTVQDLRYVYDPAGNITQIVDDALPTIFHNNKQVEPICRYTYDALYRLIEATGREHMAQSAFLFDPSGGNFRDYPFAGATQLNDLQAVRNYTETYEYDPVGNFEHMIHTANHGTWTARLLLHRTQPDRAKPEKQPLESHDAAPQQQPADRRAVPARRPRQYDLHAAPTVDAVGLPGPASGHYETGFQQRHTRDYMVRL